MSTIVEAIVLQSYYQTGQYKGKTEESFLVEKNVNNMIFNWISNQVEQTNLTVIDPSGGKYTLFEKKKNDGSIFEGVFIYELAIDNPLEGRWIVQAEQLEEVYQLYIIFNSPLNDSIHLDIEKNESIDLYISSSHPHFNYKNIQLDVTLEYMNIKDRIIKRGRFKKQLHSPKVSIEPVGEGIYNVKVHLIGKSLEGYQFNRTILDSFYYGGIRVNGGNK